MGGDDAMAQQGLPAATDVVGGKRGVVAVYAATETPKKAATDPEALFRLGLQLFERDQRSSEAAFALERAYRAKPSEARYASYYGLSLALSSNRLKDAEALCAHAVKLDVYRPELFHNLGRVRVMLRDRKGALSAFKQGLSLDRNDTKIQKELTKMGMRKPPVFSFLSRRHPLNKYFGLLLARLRGNKRRKRNSKTAK
jgi:tetratricopeptide (TPR) repeat protein